MRRVFKTGLQPDGLDSDKLWVNNPGWPQVVFATNRLGITQGFVRSLCRYTTQVFTLILFNYTGIKTIFIPIIHNPNNK